MIQGFPKEAFARGEIPIVGVVRTPVAIVNAVFFVLELLIESFINSEIVTGM